MALSGVRAGSRCQVHVENLYATRPQAQSDRHALMARAHAPPAMAFTNRTPWRTARVTVRTGEERTTATTTVP